jgi:hypothetical protein
MSATITTAFINQFKSNIFFGVQQKGSRLRNSVRNEAQHAVTAFYDGLSPTDPSELTSRHADTQYVAQTHLRRAVTLRDFVWADLIDNADKLRLLNDPTSAYANNAMMSLGRKVDDLIIEAALGTAYSGVAGATSNVLPAGQWVGATDGTNKSNLNVLTLRRIKSKFGVNDVDDSERLHICVTQSQIDALLGDDQVTSADYNSVKALVQGEIDTFMGFKFHRTQRLPTGGTGGFLADITEATGVVALSTGDGNNLRRCFAWVESGIVLAMGQDMEAKIDVMPGKNYSTQVFARMSCGAARIEEEKVVGVICSEP